MVGNVVRPHINDHESFILNYDRNEYIATTIKDKVILTFIILNQIKIDIFHPFF